MVVGIAHLVKDVKGGELRLRLLAQHGNCFVLFYLYFLIVLPCPISLLFYWCYYLAVLVLYLLLFSLCVRQLKSK